MNDEQYADFILYYRERSDDGDSFPHLWQLNKEYLHQDARLTKQSGMPLPEPALKMDSIGKTKTFDATNARLGLREEYKTKADEIARDHGFTGLSYNEHRKQQETELQMRQTQKEKPDDKEPPHSPSGSAKPVSKTPSKEEQRQAFIQQMRDAGSGLTKGKERDR